MGQFRVSIMLLQTEFIFLSIIFLFQNCFACWPWLYVNDVVVTPVKRRSIRSLTELDDKVFAESTVQAFEKCDVDGVYGVSRKEVMECEEEFCEKLNILCPMLHEFEFFDEDGNGRLTLEEYFNYT